MITCCVCGTSKPDGVRWIDVAGGDRVCSVECEQRRFLKLAEYIQAMLRKENVNEANRSKIF